MSLDDFELYGEWIDPAKTRLAGLIALDKHGRLLMQKRDNYPDLPSAGLWGLFGGHVEPHETPEAAIRREIEEELGAKIGQCTMRPLARFALAKKSTQVFMFRCETSIQACDIVLNEGAGFAFLDRGQIMDLDIAASVREYVRDFMLNLR